MTSDVDVPDDLEVDWEEQIDDAAEAGDDDVAIAMQAELDVDAE